MSDRRTDSIEVGDVAPVPSCDSAPVTASELSASGLSASGLPAQDDSHAVSEEPRQRTVWHPLFHYLLELCRPSPSWEILEEFPLSVLPPRVDMIVIRRDEGAFQVDGLSALFNRFLHPRRHRAILELKSPEDRLEANDLHAILGYLNFYNRQQQILDPEETFLITLSDGIARPFQEQLIQRYRCGWGEVEPGVWEVTGLPWALFSIDLGVASQTPGNHLLGAFTRQFLRAPQTLLPLLSARESGIIIALMQRIEQMRALPKPPYLKGMNMVDVDLVQIMQEVMTQMAPEKVKRLIHGVPPEQRMEDLSPEQRMAGLPPEQRMAGMSLEQRVEGFTPAELLAVLNRVRQRSGEAVEG